MYHERMVPQIEGLALVERIGTYFYLRDAEDGSIGEYTLTADGELQWVQDCTMAEIRAAKDLGIE